jgi:hypothetical protein
MLWPTLCQADCTSEGNHSPNVKIRSSQQLSSFTDIFHVSPVLSFAVAVVPVVIMLSGREFGDESVTGGWSILSGGLARDV